MSCVLFWPFLAALRLCSNYFFCHSGHAKRDLESSKIFNVLVPALVFTGMKRRDDVWMPVCTGMTTIVVISLIVTQPLAELFGIWGSID